MIQVGKLIIETENGPDTLVRDTEYMAKAEGREAVPDTAPSNIRMALIYGLISGILLLLLQTGSLSRKKRPKKNLSYTPYPVSDNCLRNRRPDLLHQSVYQPPGGQ